MNFFSQNSPEWRNTLIGKSDKTVGAYGCTISCVADGSSYFQEEATPGVLAKKLSFTPSGLLIWSSIGKYFKTFQFEWRFYSFDKVRIDEALKDPKRVCLVNVDKGKHWVFVVGRYIPFLGYKVSDPWHFPAKTAYRKDIVGGAILKRK